MTSRKHTPKDKALLAAIAERLAASQLPGDVRFTAAALDDAAAFAFAAGAVRSEGEGAIVVAAGSGDAGERITQIALFNDDKPFLVDSVAAAIAEHGLAIDRLVHPVISVERDRAGSLVALGSAADSGSARESLIYIEAARTDARTLVKLAATLEDTLEDVAAAVTDWPKMQAAMLTDAARLEAGTSEHEREGAALLRWLHAGMLTQLGHVTRSRAGKQTGALGICRAGMSALLSPASYDRTFAWFDRKGAQAPLIIKSNHASQVHRRVPLDLFIIPVRENGKVTALSVHAGVWTSAALAAPPSEVPLLRRQLDQLMAKFGFDPRGHDGKSLVHALTALPHDLLIGFPSGDLERVATSMMSLVDRPRSRLVLVNPPLERHLFAFAWLPRDAMNTELRLRIQSMLELAAGAQLLDWSLTIEGSNLAMLRFVIDIRNGDAGPDEAPLDAQLQAMVRGWGDAVEDELALLGVPAQAAADAARLAQAFPLAYRMDSGAGEAATDIVRLRGLGAAGAGLRRGARLLADPGGKPDQLRLKLYQASGALALSDTVPILENFGFRVIGEQATLLEDGTSGAIHAFELALAPGVTAEPLLARAAAIEAAVADVVNEVAENDAFNRLIVASGLAAVEAEWLRAWYRYLRQAGANYGIPTAVDALQNAPQVTRGLIDLFRTRHDPSLTADRARAEAKAADAITKGLTAVTAINDDRLLRLFRAVIDAVLRTNAFQPAKAQTGETALAFKLDSALVPGLPRPVPWREIFVYARRVEGIHLRAGPVARGGLRWSDRRDDFRTEVLGLMKAQRVKNAVIVPTGAKGGFYPKQLPDPRHSRDAWLAEGKASYQVFVRSLLSLTDNIVGGKVRHPDGVVVRDGEDPYFVVAADKGTATYSDTANALAAERDFWLDDAFASGGSKGYDHKAMGITARGAWLSVQRHFLELGIDVQTQSILVAGCGDMSGDVFGNGMLLSKAIRLVAAFDHRHIFLDPAPDPASSWAERQRLFALPRSSWDDYDKALISKGGGVFARSLKDIPLSAEVRDVLGITAESADPETLISAILRSPVDLMWFGGIGTYVKATAEANSQVGDPANDALRINGAELRAKAIGEGANLGCTQAGRIEFAIEGASGAGGRLNTDFIDNSAGVDCSDKEVNIKIALASARRDGRLTEPARVKLLTSMTDDVAAFVLEDNRLQALALSIAQAGGPSAMPAHIRVIEMLEELGHLDRKTEGLAATDLLQRRAADGQGLARPELAVLLSCSKLALQDVLDRSKLADNPGLEADLIAAFPPPMQRKFKADILGHRLRREIIATRLANRMINRMGFIHPYELVEEEGATLAQVTGAFVAAEALLGMAEVWLAIETAAMPEPARIVLFERAASALRSHMADVLRAGAGSAYPSGLVEQLQPGVRQLSRAAGRLLGPEALAQSRQLREELAQAGAPENVAAMVTQLFELDGVIGLARLAGESGHAPAALTGAFTAVGSALGLDWAQGAAARMVTSDTWERLLVAGLSRDFQQMRLDFLRRIAGRKADPAAAAARWLDQQDAAVRQFRSVIERAKVGAAPSPAMLAQIAGQARNLLSR